MEQVEKFNQIIDEVFINYCQTKIEKTPTGEIWISYAGHYGIISKEDFIRKIKTDNEFSQKWGLKIEERELSLGERNQIGNFDYTMCDDSLIYPTMEDDRKKYKELFDKENIPTKVITTKYQNETIETYE